MAENHSETGMMNMPHPSQVLPQDLQNIVMPSSIESRGMPLPKSQGIPMPMGNMNLMSTQNRYGNPAQVQSNGQGSAIPPERYIPQSNNAYVPEGHRNYAIPVTGISQESYVHNPIQEGLTSNVMGGTHGNRAYNMNVPFSHSMENLPRGESLPSNTDALGGMGMSVGLVPSSKPKGMLKSDTRTSPDSASGPDQRVPSMGGLPLPNRLQNEVAYKITTSDVTEAISAIRTTGSRAATSNSEPNETSAGAKSPHHLVVTAMGLVRKPMMPDSQSQMESSVPVQNYPPSNYIPPNPQPAPNLSSPVRVGPKPQSTPTVTENTMQTFTFTNTHPSSGPLLPENEMIPSSHVDHHHADHVGGRNLNQTIKQEGGRAAENMELGNYMNIASGQRPGMERKPEDMSAPVRKSYRPPKRKGVMDYDDISGANEDDSQKKKSKAMSASSSAKNSSKEEPSGNRQVPKPRSKLTVEEVYSGDEGEDTQTNSEFLKVRMLKCDKCDKHFIDKKKLAQHKRQVHNAKKGPKISTKDHVCDDCGYVFKRREHWRRHKEVHQKSRPYTCEVCDKSFKRAEHVKRHQSVHLTTKPYPCMECSSAFTRADHLTKHMLIHSDPDGYRQNQLEKKRKARVAKGKAKGAKMIKTVPRGRGKVTVQLRATVPTKKEEDFEYGDILEKSYQETDTDEDDLLSSEEEEDTTYEEQKNEGPLQKVY